MNRWTHRNRVTYAALGEQLFEIPVEQSVAQVPTNGDQDDLGREPEPGECRLGRLGGRVHTEMSHPDSLVHYRHAPFSSAKGEVALNATVP